MWLVMYSLFSGLFWLLALGPGHGGTDSVGVEWEGAVINCALLVLLWRGHNWAAWLLSIEAFIAATVILSGGIPPWGPAFGWLGLLALGQFGILASMVSNSTARNRYEIS
jgi:hypothetical protein